MIDIKLIRENRDLVKENIKNKFQNEKIAIVDEVYELDKEFRESKVKGDTLRAKKNELSKSIGILMKDKKLDEVESVKKEIADITNELASLGDKESELESIIREKMMVIPQIMDSSVPIGKDDSENVEVERFGEPKIPDYEIPYHADIIERVKGMDKDAAGRTSG